MLKIPNSKSHMNRQPSMRAEKCALFQENGVADGIRTRNNKLHKLGLYH